jgi:hypothetical protein
MSFVSESDTDSSMIGMEVRLQKPISVSNALERCIKI